MKLLPDRGRGIYAVFVREDGKLRQKCMCSVHMANNDPPTALLIINELAAQLMSGACKTSDLFHLRDARIASLLADDVDSEGEGENGESEDPKDFDEIDAENLD